MWYRVRIEAVRHSDGQRQECDRSLVADHQQAAESAGLRLLGVNAREWEITRCQARPLAEQRAA